MKEYIGLKRTRRYEVVETEEVLGLNKEGLLEIEWTRSDPVTGKRFRGIRRVTRDGRKAYTTKYYNFDNFLIPEPEKKLVNGGWDNNWPDVLKNNWPDVD